MTHKLLLERLESDDGAVAADAAWRLSDHSTEVADREKLINRLTRWRREWGSRIEEVNSRKSPEAIQSQGSIEREIVIALTRGKAWKGTPEETDRLAKGCLSKYCKDQFSKIFPPIPE